MSSRGGRGARALSQPMYLMDASRLGNEWAFQVQGSRGTCYDLRFTPETLSCTCPDFRQRRETCKHAFFMLGRVLGDVALMNRLEDGCTPRELFLGGFSERVEERLRARLAPAADAAAAPAADAAAAAADRDEDCVVCFEALASGAWSCGGCRRACMHADCATRWLERTPSCPLCRHRASTQASRARSAPPDALANFKRLRAGD
jgi:hypothetical protein